MRGWSENSFTLVPEVFLEPRESREAARREKAPSTLDLNLTFTPTPGAKRVKLIITKGTNGNLAITRPLGVTNHVDLRVCKNINQSEPDVRS